MKPAKECIEWWKSKGYTHITERRSTTNLSYFIKNEANGYADIRADEAQEIYNQVQKEKLKNIQIGTEIFMTEIVGHHIENNTVPPKYINDAYDRLLGSYKRQIKELKNGHTTKHH